MTWEDRLFEIVQFILPAGIVFLVVYHMLRKFFENEDRKRIFEIKRQNKNFTLPIRLQAYERLILFLERISLETLILRVHKKGMSARLFQAEMLNAIKSEYDHNITQQMYVSSNAWKMVKTGKDETIKLINMAADNVQKDATGAELSQYLLKVMVKIDRLPSEVALEYLKKEVKKNF